MSRIKMYHWVDRWDNENRTFFYTRLLSFSLLNIISMSQFAVMAIEIFKFKCKPLEAGVGFDVFKAAQIERTPAILFSSSWINEIRSESYSND